MLKSTSKLGFALCGIGHVRINSLNRMLSLKIAHIVLALISGALLVGYGGMDDSPGAQGIGLFTIITSLVVGVNLYRKR